RAEVERALDENDDDPTLFEELAELAFRLDDRAAADHALATSARRHAGQGDRQGELRARNRAGQLALAAGDASGAVARFEIALGLDPDDVAALAGLAEAREQLGDRAGAIEAWRRAAELAPPGAGDRNLGELGRALLAAGETAEAHLVLAQAAESDDLEVAIRSEARRA